MLNRQRMGLAIALVALAVAAEGQPKTRKDKAKSVMFYAISELTRPAGVGPSVVGGVPAEPKDWPASFYSMHGDSACTSTLVGPRALLTAAHCVAGEAKAVLRFRGQVYSSTCTSSELYKPDDPEGKTADWALCLLERAIDGITYETVNADAARVKVGSVVVLTGFGCTKPDMSGGNDGVFRTGTAPVTELPAGSSNDIKTQVHTGQATLCPGDSGGGAFLAAGGASKRIQISVNSRTQVKMQPDGKEIAVGVSYLSSVSTASAKTFMINWMKQTNQSICGLTPTAANCRALP